MSCNDPPGALDELDGLFDDISSPVACEILVQMAQRGAVGGALNKAV